MVRPVVLRASLAMVVPMVALALQVSGSHGAVPSPTGSPVPSAAPASVAPSVRPVGAPGGQSVGDPFYPHLGNTGYDVAAYDLTIAWTPPDPADEAAPEGIAHLRTVIDAQATMDLSALSLDLARATTRVERVTVDGVPVRPGSDTLGDKLILTLPEPVAAGTSFQVVVNSTAIPAVVARTGAEGPFDRVGEGRGLIADGDDGVFLAAQPNGAHLLFPVNDHPLDKARMRVTITAPPGMLGVATGALEHLAVDPVAGAISTTWVSDRELASHVLSLGIGHLELLTGTTPEGIELRSAIPRGLASATDSILAQLPEMLAWLAERLGPYPFESFGLLAYAGRPTQAILEGQTLVLVPMALLDPLLPRCTALPLVVHEATHQWFGDWASIARWDEKWLSEGHATFYEWIWASEQGCPADDPSTELETRMEAAYRSAQEVRDTYGPPARPVDPAAAYTAAIYDQGALALYALRQEVGDDAFTAIEHRFLKRYGDSAATTDDFIRIASRVARRDLDGFLRAWLFESVVPPMPGHPEWSDPEPTPSPAASPTGPTP